jgi:hypothetical protein
MVCRTPEPTPIGVGSGVLLLCVANLGEGVMLVA